MNATDTTPAKATGMRSAVTIHVATHNGTSRLASAYFTPPFKVANITEDPRAPLLDLMLMCSSPGILDGDEQTISITLEQNSRLQLHTQSYQRLFQMKTGATQSLEVQLKENSYFCWLPHPVVPHKNSIFTARNRIFLAKDTQLIWGEVLTCGRKLNGEVFALSTYHARTEIFIDNKLALLENLYLNPSILPVNAFGQLEGFTHQASLLTNIDGKRTLIEEYLSAQNGLFYGITDGPANMLIIRLLGHVAEPLHHLLKTLAGLILSQTQLAGAVAAPAASQAGVGMPCKAPCMAPQSNPKSQTKSMHSAGADVPTRPDAPQPPAYAS